MKTLTVFFSLFCLLQPVRLSAQESSEPGGKTLHIIYVDNSNPGRQANGGLSKNVLSTLFTIADSVSQRKDSAMLLFISNGDRPYSTCQGAEMPSLLQRLTEEVTRPPSAIQDHGIMSKIIYRRSCIGISTVRIDIFITYNVYASEFTTNQPEIIKFFPPELLAATKAGRCTVNVYISNFIGNETEEELKRKYLVDRRFRHDYSIVYNFHKL